MSIMAVPFNLAAQGREARRRYRVEAKIGLGIVSKIA
jgi:hypothetical protein